MAVRVLTAFVDFQWCWCVLVLLWTPCFVRSGQYDNVALDKTCTMSSTWSGPPWRTETPRGVSLAVDGSIDATRTAEGCVHTGYEDRNCSWQVDLGRPFSIHRMVSWGRTDLDRRMQRVIVTVDDSPCFVYPNFVNNRRYEFTCTNGVTTGTRVRLSKASTNSDPEYTINLCEFQVFTCSDGYWGPTCDYGCGFCSVDTPVCDKVTGACWACKPGYKIDTPNWCTQVCDDGSYGANCASQCSIQCRDVCNKVTGYCSCKPGYQGVLCDALCDDGRYGQDCRQSCGRGCSNSCDKVTGACFCSPGWQRSYCYTECSNGRYGQDCSQSCSTHCSNVCNKQNGTCACTPGYQTPFCRDPCPAGSWGQDCQLKCSANCADVCDHVTGQCSCKPGWRGSTCELECGQGVYGQDCKLPCGNCEQGTFCHHVTGHCPRCQDFYDLPFCTECVDYKYGSGCRQDCSENCQDVCNKVQGHCTCNAGWQEPRCVQECAGGTYGLRCEEKCGNCSDGRTSCDHVTGSCPLGCLSGWSPPLCQLALQQSAEDGGGGDVGPIVGAVVGVIVIAAVVVVIVIIIRRRGGFRAKSATEEPLDTPPSAIVNGESNNRKMKQASFSNRDDIYQNVTVDPQDSGGIRDGHRKPPTAAKPMLAVKPKMTKSLTPDSAATAIYENSPTINPPSHPPTTSTLPRTSHPPTSNPEADAADEADDDLIHGDVYYNDDTYMTSEGVQLGLDSVQQYLLDQLRAKDLDKEFEKLEKGLAREHTVGSAEENYYKNRFKTILPYDTNRVVLHEAPHSGANDYVNASFVRGWKSEKAYIAAQGPGANTMEDMWWMMWQEGVTHIVMLTSVKEADKIKCEEYWPGVRSEKKYGSICVRMTELHNRADYVIRTFDVKEAIGGPSRKVTQFHFVTWPDHDVPSVTSLVDFWCSVSWSYRNQPTARVPLLVHCSAGVGRTGAFIALDILMQQTQHSTSVSVQQAAAQLRHDRCNMIQTKAQYRLVYEAVLEAYSSRECRTAVSTVDTLAPLDPRSPNTLMDTHFQKLQQMKMLLKKPCHRMAEEEVNINKNRDVSVLPDDNYIVYLTYHIRGRNQYINAVYTSTFFKRRGCIMTQLPLRDTVIDFWRLVVGDDVTTIISLGTEEEKMETGECYWPATKGQRQTHGPFSLILHSVTPLGPRLTSYDITLTVEWGQEARDVRLLRYSGWQEQLPEEMTDLMQLLCVVTEQDARDEQTPPILLQCRDGAVRSGLVRVIADVISRMTSDGQVDVYTAVKRVQNVRPQCVSTMEEFRFISVVIQRYRQSNSVYENT